MTSDSQAKLKRFSYLNLKLKVLETFKYLNIIFQVIKPYFLVLVLNYVVNLVQTCMNWYSPMYTGGIIDIVTRSKDSDHLFNLLRDMFLFTLISQQVSKICGKANNKAYAALNRNLKGEIYKKILDCDMEFFDQISTQEASMILNTGVENLINLCIYQFTSTMQSVFSIFGSLYQMYAISPDLAKVIMMTMPLRFGLIFFGYRSHTKLNDKLNNLYSDVWTLPMQAIQNILLVKCFSTEEKEHKEYVETQKQLKEIEAEYNGEPFLIDLGRTLINEGLTLFLIYRGGQMVFTDKITAGDLSMFNAYSSTFTNTASSIHYSFKHLYSAYTNSLKILKLLEQSSKVKGRQSQNLRKEKLSGTISINNVSFCYPSKPEVEVLSDISLKINAGESVAFVGVSGSGKTTLSYLLQNLYVPTQGKIHIDGEDVRDYDLTWLHHHMGYVSQEPVLLDKTVEQNIVYGIEDGYSEEQVEKALTLSNSKFILNKDKFPDGLKTKLGSGKTKLSGGQKQRIAIARAFIKDPKILILDEPTSALDGESESKVQKAIDDLIALGDRTVIVIAHRLSTIINCHKIVVFDEGKIVEQGTHRELIAKDGAYKKLFEFQINNMKNL